MGESEKSSSVSGNVSNDNKGNFMIPLATWIVFGVLIGLGVYLLFFQPANIPIPPVINVTGNGSQNNTVPQISEVTLTLISDSRCSNCTTASYLADQLTSLATQFGFSIKDKVALDSQSTEAKALISKYSITRLPTLIVSKEAKTSSDFTTGWANIGSEEADGAFVYRNIYPPYFDMGSGKTVGFVESIIITPNNCTECFNATPLLDYLSGESMAIVITKRTQLAADSTEAKALIMKYNITKLPAILLSPEASVYPPINQTWSAVGSVESDGWHVYRSANPPYVDLENNGSIEGLVKMVELSDPTCTECYNVSVHYAGLGQSFGLKIVNLTSELTNSTAGKALIAKYNITKVPTVLLSPEASLYPSLNQSWPSFGSVESDGWLVFRELSQVGTYKDLTTNLTVNASVG